jgi:rRNA maturation endonuclease Nob1
MQYCINCDKEFDTTKTKCPICGCTLVEEEEGTTAEIVATMTTLNIL